MAQIKDGPPPKITDPDGSFMASKQMRCPECGAAVAANDIRSPSFTCKQCHRELSMPRRYWLIVRLSTAPVTFLLCFALGLRGIILFVVCAAALPLVGGLVVIPLSFRLFPPTLQKYLPEGSLGLDSK